jgi:hypothetical protein
MLHHRTNRTLAALVALLGAAPASAGAASPEVDASPDEAIAAPAPRAPDLHLVLALAEPSASTPGMDFDLLGEAKPPPMAPDAGALRLRRAMLTAHQAVGFGLIGLQLATTVAGQLNYSDRFHGGPSTARYQLTHAALAYTTLGVFAANGAIALLAPSPVKRSLQMDRVMVHRISMLTAAAGMVTQGVLGIVTRDREGYLNQQRFATAHLVIGYATLAAMATGVGALIF